MESGRDKVKIKTRVEKYNRIKKLYFVLILNIAITSIVKRTFC